MAYNTGNPVGSTDPRDLFDNAGIVDQYANGPNPLYPDRFGVQRLSLSGQRYNFDQSMAGWDAAFQQFLAGSGFEAPVSYAAGVTLERATQTFVRDNVQYRIKDPADLPYTLTGDWGMESDYFASMGDSGLRQDITSGNFLVSDYVQVVGEEGRETRSLKEWMNKKKAVFLLDYLSNAEIDSARGVTPGDVTAKFAAAVTETIEQLPCSLFLDEGTFVINQSSLPNLAKTGLEILGSGVKQTVIKMTAAGRGLNFDAFEGGNASTPFAQSMMLSGFTVEGNSASTNIFDMQGIARSEFKNINAREARNSDGVAFNMRGVMLSHFTGLYCSTDLQAMTNIPREGLHLDEGRRAGASVGNSSNNVFTACYFEGLPIGIRCFLGDQNTFIGGSPESCTVYGLLIGPNSRYNMFLGTGFENAAETATDIADGGVATSYLNCYASKLVVLQGRDCRIEGGYFQKIQVDAGAKCNYVGGVTLRHWEDTAPPGGLVDNGDGTRYGSIYDSVTSAYITPKKARTAISVTASPFTFTNNRLLPVEVIIQGGTVTQVRKGDGTGDLWLVSAASPNSHLLMAGDVLEVSYSALPNLAVRPLNSI